MSETQTQPAGPIPELDLLVEAGALPADKAEALAEHHRSAASSSALRVALSIFVTLAAASIMSISFVALLALTIRDLSPELLFFLALVAYGLAARGLWHFKLEVPAATLASVGLVTSAGCALAAKAYLPLCLLWFVALALALRFTRRAIDHALLYLTGAGVLFAVMCRALPELGRYGEDTVRLASGLLVPVGFATLVWARRWRWRSLAGERRLRPLYEALGLALSLGGLFVASQRFEGAYQGPDIALGLGAFLVYTAAAVLSRRRSALFAIALGYWSLFLFWKYYELFYDLLGGSLILLVLGLALLGLARRFAVRARRGERKVAPCAS